MFSCCKRLNENSNENYVDIISINFYDKSLYEVYSSGNIIDFYAFFDKYRIKINEKENKITINSLFLYYPKNENNLILESIYNGILVIPSNFNYKNKKRGYINIYDNTRRIIHTFQITSTWLCITMPFNTKYSINSYDKNNICFYYA